MANDNPFGTPLGEVPQLPRVDAASVIRRSGRRRLVRQVAVGGVATLAVVGFVGGIGLGIRTFGVGAASSTSAGSATDGAADPEYSAGGKSVFEAEGTVTKPRFECGAAMPSAATSLTSAGVTLNLQITRPRADTAAGTGFITVTSSATVPATLRDADPIIVVGRGGTVTSVVTLDSGATPQDLSLTAGQVRRIEGRLSSSTCSPDNSITPTKDDILIVLPVVVDGENRWLTAIPAKVTVR